MTGENRGSDLSNRLNVKRGGKLISKTLGKSSSPPSISASPQAAVGVSHLKKNEAQRSKNPFHDMLRGSPKDRDSGHIASLNVPAAGARGNSNSTAAITATVDRKRSSEHRKTSTQEHDRPLSGRKPPEQQKPYNSQDGRLAELEIALTAAKEEAAMLRGELDRVRQDAQASAEVLRHQTQHQVPSEDAKMQTESEEETHGEIQHQGFEQDRDLQSDLIAQNHTIRYRLAELQDQLVTLQAQQEPRRSESDWNALTLRLHETEKESYARLQQLLSLKSSISSLTRTDSQVSDAELAEAFSQLANRVREWVVSNYRRSKMSLDGLPEASVSVLRTIKTDFETIDRENKLPFYQAVVSRILMRLFDEPSVVGMPDTGFWAGLRDFANKVQLSGVDIREWRRTTLQLVESSMPAASLRIWRNKHLEHMARDLESIMLSISSTDITSSARSALNGILNAAADIQRTLCLQKSGYKVNFFDAPDDDCLEFDDRAMEPINGLEDIMDEDTVLYVHRGFVFCVFPSLQKTGFDKENIVFKARVCCGVG